MSTLRTAHTLSLACKSYLLAVALLSAVGHRYAHDILSALTPSATEPDLLRAVRGFGWHPSHLPHILVIIGIIDIIYGRG